jgi:hypothetical protein
MEAKIQGGPPPPKEYCAQCNTELTGKPEHCKDEEEHLFCNHQCKEAFQAKLPT